MKRRISNVAIIAMMALLTSHASAAIITMNLNSLTESVMVGQADISELVAPAAPGDGWFTGTYAGTIRGRFNPDFNLRTQWNFRFDASALTALDPTKYTIVGAVLRIPQIGRLNGNSAVGAPFNLYANTYDWAADGSSDYPTWNRGRTDAGGDGFTVAPSFGGANTHVTAADLSNPNVEGSFVINTAGLLTAVQNWSADPTTNEGFLMTWQAAQNAGIAFGTPSLEITVVPEPSTIALSALAMIGMGIALRRRRTCRQALKTR